MSESSCLRPGIRALLFAEAVPQLFSRVKPVGLLEASSIRKHRTPTALPFHLARVVSSYAYFSYCSSRLRECGAPWAVLFSWPRRGFCRAVGQVRGEEPCWARCKASAVRCSQLCCASSAALASVRVSAAGCSRTAISSPSGIFFFPFPARAIAVGFFRFEYGVFSRGRRGEEARCSGKRELRGACRP
jgi:hypothetical protein